MARRHIANVGIQTEALAVLSRCDPEPRRALKLVAHVLGEYASPEEYSTDAMTREYNRWSKGGIIGKLPGIEAGRTLAAFMGALRDNAAHARAVCMLLLVLHPVMNVSAFVVNGGVEALLATLERFATDAGILLLACSVVKALYPNDLDSPVPCERATICALTSAIGRAVGEAGNSGGDGDGDGGSASVVWAASVVAAIDTLDLIGANNAGRAAMGRIVPALTAALERYAAVAHGKEVVTKVRCSLSLFACVTRYWKIGNYFETTDDREEALEYYEANITILRGARLACMPHFVAALRCHGVSDAHFARDCLCELGPGSSSWCSPLYNEGVVDDHAGAARLAEVDGVPAIIAAMRTHIADERLVYVGAYVLQAASLNARNTAAMVEERAAFVLTDAARRYASNAPLMAAVTCVLGRVTEAGDEAAQQVAQAMAAAAEAEAATAAQVAPAAAAMVAAL